MPAPIRLLHISDLHLKDDPAGEMRGAVTLRTLEAVLARASAGGAFDAVLVTGDLTHDEPGAYAHLNRLFAECPVPVVCLPGNHDESRTAPQYLQGDAFRWLGSLSIGGWALVALDSTIEGAVGGRLSDRELMRLDATLAATELPCLVALHHPPVPVGSLWLDGIGLADAESFWSVIRRHRHVRAVLFGHAHQAFDAVHDDVHVLGCPATCVQFLPGSADFALDTRPAGWRTHTLHPDGRLESDVHWLTDL